MPPSAAGSSPNLPQEDLSKDPLLRDLPRDPQGRPLLGRIPLVCRIGKGGMGAVYYAIHPRLQVEVAVKVLPFHLLDQDPKLAERFSAEARMAAGLSNHHVVRVLDVDQEEGTHFLVMEYVAGESAGAYLKRRKAEGKGGLDEREALEIVTAAAKGLAAAHERGIIHRDIKPDNILVPKGPGGALDFKRAKVADLGLAKPEGAGQSIGTLSHVAMGTPGYMAPEQIEDARSAGRPADIFSMGATLYGLISGQAPFRGTSLGVILRDTMEKDPEDLTTQVSPTTREVIFRCLSKDPARRPADGGELVRTLEALLPPASTPSYDATIPYEKTALLGGSRPGSKSGSRPSPPSAPPAAPPGARPADASAPSAPPPPRRGLPAAAILLVLLLASGAAGAAYYFHRKTASPPPPADPGLAAKPEPPKPEPRKPEPAVPEPEIAHPEPPKPEPAKIAPPKPAGPDPAELKLQAERREQRKLDFDKTSKQAQAETEPATALALWKVAAGFAEDPKDAQAVQARIREQEALISRKNELRTVSQAARAEHDLQKRLELWRKAESLADADKARATIREQIEETERLAKRKSELESLSSRALSLSDPGAALALWKKAGEVVDDPKDAQEIQRHVTELATRLGRQQEYEVAATAARAESDPAKAVDLWKKAEGLAQSPKERQDAHARVLAAERKGQRRREFEAACAQAESQADPAAAVPLWKQARDLADDPKDREPIQARIGEIEAFLSRKKEFDAAAAQARAEKDPTRALALWEKAQSLADGAQDIDLAKGQIRELNKERAKGFYDKGVACWTKQDINGAIDWFTKTIELDPTQVFAYSYRGSARRKQNDLDGSIDDYSHAIELNPKYATAYANRGTSKFDKRDYPGAIDDYSKAIEIDPQNAVFYQNRGNAKLRAGDRNGASTDFSYAAQLKQQR